jgi:hypothetical protein
VSCEFFKKCPWGADCHGQCSQIEFVVGMHEGRVTLDFGGVLLGGMGLVPDAAMDLANALTQFAQAAMGYYRKERALGLYSPGGPREAH